MNATACTASRVFQTAWGYIGIAATEKGLTRVVLPHDDRAAVESELRNGSQSPGAHPPDAPESRAAAIAVSRAEAILDQARGEILEYLEGKRRSFDVPLDVPDAPAFTRSVWTACEAIPFGQVRSYGDLARAIGRATAMRAVGQALGANPLPIVIPCHRVLRGNGTLGGFGGGLPLKQRLLALEGR